MSRASAQLSEPTSGDQRIPCMPEARKGSSRYTRPRRSRAVIVANSRSTLLEVAITGPRQRSTVGITKLTVLPDRVGPNSSRLWRRVEATVCRHGVRPSTIRPLRSVPVWITRSRKSRRVAHAAP
jgi:hypothetical protein